MVSEPQWVGPQMAAGAAWTVLFRFVDRSLSIVSTVVLARLLVPADFGLIAMAMSVIVILDLLGAFGLDTALIQRSDAGREHYDTLWTFNVIFGLGTALLLVLLASPAAWLYRDPRLVPVMLVLALARAIQGFENPGVVSFRKDMQFDQEFKYLLAKRVATTAFVTIPLAFVLRSYWALLAGTLAGTCIAVALSYALHPYRPRPSLKALGQLMAFSKWLFLTSFLEFLYARMSDLIVGRWAGADALGSLTIAREVARVPTRELAMSVNRAVFPGYVKLAADRALLRRGYLRATSVLLLVVVPAGIGLSLLAEPLVLIFLGEKWKHVAPLIEILSLNGVLATLLSTAHHVNLAVGMSRSTSLVLATHSAITIPLMLWWVPSYGSQGAAVAMLAASIVTAPLNFLLLGRAIEFGRRELVGFLGRPVAGSLVMIGAVVAIQGYWPVPSSLLGQIVYVAFVSLCGALVYAASVFSLWRPWRDPDSAEAWVLDRAARFAQALGQRVGAPFR